MKIDFENVEIYSNCSHTKCMCEDIKESVADGIYKTCHGVAALSLAMKIYNSSKETDFTENECNIIKNFADQYATGNLIEAINNILKKK